MLHVLLMALLACGGTTAPSTPDAPAASGPTIELPDPYEQLAVPTDGAEIQKQEGDEIVLNYPGRTMADLLGAYKTRLESDGWTLETPQNGGRFVRVQASKGKQKLEYFVVKQPERTEVHMELVRE